MATKAASSTATSPPTTTASLQQPHLHPFPSKLNRSSTAWPQFEAAVDDHWISPAPWRSAERGFRCRSTYPINRVSRTERPTNHNLSLSLPLTDQTDSRTNCIHCYSCLLLPCFPPACGAITTTPTVPEAPQRRQPSSARPSVSPGPPTTSAALQHLVVDILKTSQTLQQPAPRYIANADASRPNHEEYDRETSYPSHLHRGAQHPTVIHDPTTLQRLVESHQGASATNRRRRQLCKSLERTILNGFV